MTVQLYSDETFCAAGSFDVIASIWGNPSHCSDYSNDVAGIIAANTRLGKDFKGLHAVNLNADNWSTLGPTFEAVLNKLFQYVSEGKLNIRVTLISGEKYEANAGYLKQLLRRELENRESDIGKQFSSLKDEDLPALYHRIDQLIVYLLYRDHFGLDGDEFEYYPDSSGKILHYKEREFEVSGTLPFSWPLPFYDLVKIQGNAWAKTIKLAGWPTKKHELVKFQPLKWQENYLVQSCDILSNFTFNHLRYSVGLTDKKYQLKSNALLKHFDLADQTEQIKATFKLNDSGNDVVCKDPSLHATLHVK